MSDAALRQRMQALEAANERKAAMKTVRDSIRALAYTDGLRYVADLLADPDETVKRMTLMSLLQSVRALGPYRSATILRQARVIDGRSRVRDVAPFNLGLLAGALRERGHLIDTKGRIS